MRDIRKFTLSLLLFSFIFYLLSTPVYGVSPYATNAATWKVIKSERLQEIKEERERIRQEIRERKEEASAAAKLKREELKERLTEIKDTRKRLTIQRIDLNLFAVNEKWVNHWNRALTRLSELLVKIQTRTDKAEAAGYDVDNINLAIIDAQSAISDAQNAVNTQVGKTYVIEIEDEGSLGSSVSLVVHQMRDDLKDTREYIVSARDKVKEVLKLLKTIRNIDEVGVE